MIVTKFVRMMTLWLWGGFAYYLIELAWRGFSHPSMFIVGGICILVLGSINNYLPWEMPLLWQSLIGAVAITIIEFISGIIVNIWLGLGVWDYTHLPLNVLGQVSLLFFFLWIPVAAFAIWLDDFLRWKLYDDERPHYNIVSTKNNRTK